MYSSPAQPGTPTIGEIQTFYVSEFTRSEKYTRDTLELRKLTNQIHPLFAESKWIKDKSFRHITGAKFSVIEQSCHLASQIITSGVLDHFFYLLLFVEPTRIDQTRWQSEYKQILSSYARTMTPIMKQRVQQELRAIAATNWVKYSFQRMRSLGAHTNPLRTAGVPDPHSKPNGRRSHIHLSTKMYEAIDNSSAKGDLCREIYSRWHFAITLVHELAHSLRYLREGRQNHVEPYFGKEIVAEVGFSLEVQLFSGHLDRMMAGDESDTEQHYYYEYDGKVSELTGLLVLTQWPCRRLANEYQNNARAMRIREQGFTTNGFEKVQPHDVAWRVPLTFIANLFTDAFWGRVAVHGLSELKPELNNGHCFRAKGENHQPIRCPPGEICYRVQKKDEYRSLPGTGDIVTEETAEAFKANPRLRLRIEAPTKNNFASLASGRRIATGRVQKSPTKSPTKATRRSPRKVIRKSGSFSLLEGSS